MGNLINLQATRDAKITGTADARKLALIVKIYTMPGLRNNVAQRAKLAAAKRLLGGVQ